jgi:hypothetical protein
MLIIQHLEIVTLFTFYKAASFNCINTTMKNLCAGTGNSIKKRCQWHRWDFSFVLHRKAVSNMDSHSGSYSKMWSFAPLQQSVSGGNDTAVKWRAVALTPQAQCVPICTVLSAVPFHADFVKATKSEGPTTPVYPIFFNRPKWILGTKRTVI